MPITKPVVVNGVTKANAELFNEYGVDIETVSGEAESALSQLGSGQIVESQLNAALLGPAANKYGLRKLGTGATEAAAGSLIPSGGSAGQALLRKGTTETEWGTVSGSGISKSEAETIAQEAVKKSVLPSAIAVATANVTLSGIPAVSSVDEVTVVEGSIVLAPNQTAEKERGLWEVKSGAWVRPAGFTTGTQLPLGVTVAVTEGKEYKGSIWELKNKTRVTIGTTAQEWEANSAGGTVGQAELEAKGYFHYSEIRTGSLAGTTASNMAMGIVGDEKLAAMQRFFETSKAEQEKHHGNVAIGPEALARLTGVVQQAKPRANTAISSKKFHLPTGANETLAPPYWVTNNVPNLTFAAITPGVTGIATGLPYWIVNRSGTEFELIQASSTVSQAEIESKASKSEGLVTIAGHELEAATTEFILSTSCEDNTALGAEAMAQTVNSGGNVFIGQRAGWKVAQQVEENVGIGIEALHNLQLTGLGKNVAVGSFAGQELSTGGEDIMVGWKSGAYAGSGSRNVYVGNYTGEISTQSDNVMVGHKAGSSASSGEGYNVIVGCEAGERAGNSNTYIGINAGEVNTGNSNVFIGAFAGHYQGAVSNRLIVSSVQYSTEAEETADPALITGQFPNVALALNAEAVTLGKSGGEVGLYGVTPAKRAATFGELTALTATSKECAERINSIRTALKNLGVIE